MKRIVLILFCLLGSGMLVASDGMQHSDLNSPIKLLGAIGNGDLVPSSRSDLGHTVMQMAILHPNSLVFIQKIREKIDEFTLISCIQEEKECNERCLKSARGAWLFGGFDFTRCSYVVLLELATQWICWNSSKECEIFYAMVAKAMSNGIPMFLDLTKIRELAAAAKTESVATAKGGELIRAYQANMDLIKENILRGGILPNSIAPSGETLLQSIVKTKNLSLVKKVGEAIDRKTFTQCVQWHIPLTETKKIAERLLWVSARGADGIDATQTAVNLESREIVNELVKHWMHPLVKDTAGVACVYGGAGATSVGEPAAGAGAATVKKSSMRTVPEATALAVSVASSLLNNLLSGCGTFLLYIGFPIQLLTEEVVISALKKVDIDVKNKHIQKIIHYMTKIDYSPSGLWECAERYGCSVRTEEEARWRVMFLVRSCFLSYIKEKIDDGTIAEITIDEVENIIVQYHCLALYEYQRNMKYARNYGEFAFLLPIKITGEQLSFFHGYAERMQHDAKYCQYTDQFAKQPFLLQHMNEECSCYLEGVECGLRADVIISK